MEIVNQGGAVELIALEFIEKELEQLDVKLPTFPLTLKKSDKLSIPIAAKAGSHAGNKVKLKLESVLGPVQDFMVAIQVK